MFVVLGASGRAGGETANALLTDGERVRVVLRRPEQADRWKALGAEVAIAGIDDGPSLAAAFAGATGAFLLSPPPVDGDPDARAEVVGRALAQAVRQSDLERTVVLSSIGAQHATGTGVIGTLHTLESHLDSAPSVTFLRPGYFVESWEEVAAAVFADGVLPSFLNPMQKIPMVSTIDVGRTAAALLCGAAAGARVVELRGPQDWSAEDVAEAFGAALGRRIEPLFVPSEARAPVLVQQGIPPQIAVALLGMYDGIATRRVEHEEGRPVLRGSCSLQEAVERIVRKAADRDAGLLVQAAGRHHESAANPIFSPALTER